MADQRLPVSEGVIGYAVWAYHRFAFSLRDVEDLLAERGVTVSYETIRDWVNRFGHGSRVRRNAVSAQASETLERALCHGDG